MGPPLVYTQTNLCTLLSVCLYSSALSLKIQLSREKAWDPINRFNAVTFLCLSQVTHVSYGLFVFKCFDVRGDCLVVNIGGIVDHHCLNKRLEKTEGTRANNIYHLNNIARQGHIITIA